MYPNMKECARRIEKQGVTVKTSANSNVPLHTHKWFELVYIVKGQTEYATPRDHTVVREGNFYLIDYDLPHEYHRISNEPFSMVNIMFAPDFIDPGLVGFHHFDDLLSHYLIHFEKEALCLSPLRTIHNDPNGLILGHMNAIQSGYAVQKTGFLETVRCYLLLILISMMRNIGMKGMKDNENRSFMIAEYIRSHYAERVRIEDTFPHKQYSLPYMSKCFKHDMGMTFSEYLKKTRVEESCRLLLNGSQSVGEIALAVGYPDTTAYHRAFKALMRMSPYEYRKRYRNLPRPDAENAVREKIDKNEVK